MRISRDRGSKSRNKVSVGEPSDGSLPKPFKIERVQLHTSEAQTGVNGEPGYARQKSVWALATQSDSWGTRQESADDSGSKRPWELGRPVGTWGTYRAPALG